jgi:solute carrier family 35 protein C2
MSKILLGAFIAFFMEMCEVLVVGYTSSLTLSIAGIVKVKKKTTYCCAAE